MMFRQLTVLHAFGYAFVAGVLSKHIVHERRSDILLQQWIQGARLQPDYALPVRIGLTQTNLDKAHDVLMSISTPGSPSYGKHMSADEVVNFFAPKNESIEAVTSWLTSAGVKHSRLVISPNKQWIKFDAPVTEIERLLHAEFHIYQHQSTFEEDIAAEHYSVPQHAREHVDYITPGIRLRSLRSSRSKMDDDEQPKLRTSEHHSKRSSEFDNCTAGMTPQCIAAIYNISEATTAVEGNDIGFYERWNVIYHQPDFDLYTKKYCPRIPQGFGPKKFLSVDGASIEFNKTFDGDNEAMLDVDAALPIIYPQGFTIWQTEGAPAELDLRGFFNTWLDALDGSYCNFSAYGITGDSSHSVDPSYPIPAWPHPEQCGVYKPTNVISVSYGDAEAGFPVAYVKRQCLEYLKLGMRGKSIFFCSQDSGVGGGMGAGANGCLGPNDTIFAPVFPATCPYVTSVGATAFPPGADVLNPLLEEAARFSGGGFSNVWPAPTYQKAAVEHYLITYPPSHPSYATKNEKDIGGPPVYSLENDPEINAGADVWNRNGRGTPDVSALGEKFTFFSNGTKKTDFGTSLSTPLWAAMVNRVNEERLRQNKTTVGFVNPALYDHPGLMRDIVKGSNFGCGKNGTGFNVTEGWDPVTGLGSPSFPALMEYFSGLE